MSTSTYRPIVDTATGREYQEGDAEIPSTAIRLEPTGVANSYRDASTGETWIGCTDGIWRHGASLRAQLQPSPSKERMLAIIGLADHALEQHPLDVGRETLAEIKRLAREQILHEETERS